MGTFWNRSLLFFALLAAPALASAMPLESGLARGAFSEASSFRALASAGALLPHGAPHGQAPRGAMLLASVALLGLVAVRRLRAP